MNHEEKIRQIETETAELKHQIMKLEFQHKKDIIEAEKEFNERHNKIQKHLDYITKLARITYEELDLLDEKITKGGEILAAPRKRV